MNKNVAVVVLTGSTSQDLDGDIAGFLATHLTEFVEISEERLALIRKEFWRIQYNSNQHLILVEQQDRERAKTTLDEFEKAILEHMEKEEKRKLAAQKKSAEAVAKAKKTKEEKLRNSLLKDKLTRKRIFAELKDEFEGGVTSG